MNNYTLSKHYEIWFYWDQCLVNWSCYVSVLNIYFKGEGGRQYAESPSITWYIIFPSDRPQTVTRPGRHGVIGPAPTLLRSHKSRASEWCTRSSRLSYISFWFPKVYHCYCDCLLSTSSYDDSTSEMRGNLIKQQVVLQCQFEVLIKTYDWAIYDPVITQNIF